MTAPTATKSTHPLRRLAAVGAVAAVTATLVTQCPGPSPLSRPGSTRELVAAATYDVTNGDGEFRTNCQRAHYNNDDRIVYPDQPGKAHRHVYFGADEVDADTDPIDSAGSTCEGGILNRTGYWVPALLDGNGDVIDVVQTENGRVVRDALQVYYKTGYRGVRPATIQPFPANLKMIAGDGKGARITDTTKVWWTCQPVLTIDQNIAHQASIPPSCNGYLQLAVEFPQCWDGVNTDSPDHKSHMAYGLGWGSPGSGCPTTHPVGLPQITEFVRWPWRGSTAGVHLSCDLEGAPGGSCGHADWQNGWDPETMRKIVVNCLRPTHDCRMNLLGDGPANPATGLPRRGSMLVADPSIDNARRGTAPTGTTTIPPVTTPPR